MMNRLLTKMAFSVIATQLISLSASASDKPFRKATLTDARGEVSIIREGKGSNPAVIGNEISGLDILKTEKKSRAEIEFEDHSLTRLGSSSIFSFDPRARLLILDRGTMLLHIPPNQGGGRVKTPSATAAVTGDTLVIQVLENLQTKFISLSNDPLGPITIQLLHDPFQRCLLEAGKMLIIPSGAKALPLPVEIDLAQFTQTSPLLTEGNRPLPASALMEIHSGIQKQNIAFKNGELIRESDNEKNTDPSQSPSNPENEKKPNSKPIHPSFNPIDPPINNLPPKNQLPPSQQPPQPHP